MSHLRKIINIYLLSHTKSTLNDFAALGREYTTSVRNAIQQAFKPDSSYKPPLHAVIPVSQAKMHIPVHVGDFTDFSCSEDHVVNAGEAVFGKRAVPPGFPHYPLGYGGRSSSIVISETPVQRPLGQYRSKIEEGSVLFGPCQDLDYELELACIIGKPVRMGDIATAADADEHIFGVALLNDWSGTKPFPSHTYHCECLSVFWVSSRHTWLGDCPIRPFEWEELYYFDLAVGCDPGRFGPIRHTSSSP